MMAHNQAPSVAVVGLGIKGIAAVKNLKEVGFDVIGFDANGYIGGLWQYTEDAQTSVMANTTANISKDKFCYTDFPYEKDVPRFPRWSDVVDYFKAYVEHFSLNSSFRLNSRITSVVRVKSHWELEILNQKTGDVMTENFDKVVVCIGSNQIPILPNIEGIENFQGQILNSNTHKKPQELRNKSIIIVGLGATSVDIATGLVGIAQKVYISHRRGCILLPTHNGAKPWDRMTTMSSMIRTAAEAARDTTSNRSAGLERALTGLTALQNKHFDIRPTWGISNPPALSQKQPIIADSLYPSLQAGDITLLPGISTISSPKTLTLTDGRSLQDIDTILFSAGYKASYNLLGPHDPTLSTNPAWQNNPNSNGRALPRLYQGIFSLSYPDSLAYMETFMFSFSACLNGDLTSMAIAQIWLGNASLPPKSEMEAAVDAHHAYLLRLVEQGPTQPYARDAWAWGCWADEVSGCGVHERLGSWRVAAVGWRRWFRWKSWRGWVREWCFWLFHRRLYYLLRDGVYSPAIYRLFPSKPGRRGPGRKTWSGALKEIERVNAEQF